MTPVTTRMRFTRTGAVLALGMVMLAPTVGLGAGGTPKVPPRHVVCAKITTWIPADYNGGCYLSFSPAIRSGAYAGFTPVATGDSEWAGANAGAAVTSMRCTRGGTVNGMKIDRWQSGTCAWNETYQHVGYDGPPKPHYNHQWQCEITVVVTSAPNGKMRRRSGRLWLQWRVSFTPLQDLTRFDGEWPWCNKTVPEDTWT